MNMNFTAIIGLIFLVWMTYFALGAFANMTENPILLKLFKAFKYIGIIIIVIGVFFILYY
jgi:hypothetical protein